MPSSCPLMTSQGRQGLQEAQEVLGFLVCLLLGWCPVWDLGGLSIQLHRLGIMSRAAWAISQRADYHMPVKLSPCLGLAEKFVP